MSVPAAYGVWALPSTFIIDRQGNRAHFANGPRDWDGQAAHELFESMLEVGARAMTESLGVAVAFSAGLFSFLSPCVLPLFPSYLSFITGMSVDRLAGDVDRRRGRRVLLHSSRSSRASPPSS